MIKSAGDDKNKKIKYPEKAMEHMLRPGNFGRMTDPDGAAVVKGQCGETMEMYLIIKNDRITKILFYSNGCGIVLACGSVVTELAMGRGINEALKISPSDIIDKLESILRGHFHCAVLSVITLYKALADYMLKKET